MVHINMAEVMGWVKARRNSQRLTSDEARLNLTAKQLIRRAQHVDPTRSRELQIAYAHGNRTRVQELVDMMTQGH